MRQDQALVISPLERSHDRSHFCCGIEALDGYLKRQARQDTKRRVSRVFVATTACSPERMVGYYTLSTLSIDVAVLPAPLSRQLPKHPIPAALLGRLAVAKEAQGLGVGKMLLMDAIKRTLNVSDTIAIYALVVGAINEDALEFYQHYGFSRLQAGACRLYLPLKSIQ